MCKSAQFITQICEKPWDQSRGCILRLAGVGMGGVKQAERNWRTRAFAPQVLDCEAKSSRHMRSHVCVSLSSSLPLSLFSGSRTEQDKTQPIVTLVETAHALFTGGSPFFRRQCVINAALNVFFYLFIYYLFFPPSPSTLLDHHDSGRASAFGAVAAFCTK